MNSLKKIFVILVVLLSVKSFAQVKNTVTETVKVSGNCGMCKSIIEKAGSTEHGVKVLWDAESQLAKLTYDPSKTSKNQILKKIASAGYDNEKFSAPDHIYDTLHGCCQYDRTLKADAYQDTPDNAKTKYVTQ